MTEKKKVGNACRSKNQIRNSKARGSSFEYDCQHSLQKWANYPVIRLAERGFQMQYDLRIDTDSGYIAFECKRLKGISWNQAVKFYDKLEEVTPDAAFRILLFQSNRQPCLVMQKKGGAYQVSEFKSIFHTSFEKHPSTRVTKK
jgi:hypothetical protein